MNPSSSTTPPPSSRLLPGTEERALAPLHRGLGYGRFAALLGGGALFVPLGWIVTGLAGLAMAFTPYMLWRLHLARWHGWMAAFAAVVGLPFVASRFADATSVTGLLLSLAPLLLFYLYTWALHASVGERLSELRGARDIARDRHRRHA